MSQDEHQQEPDEVLQNWLDDGCEWLAQLQKIGLSTAGRELLDRGRAWHRRGGLLGWQQTDALFHLLLREDAAMSARASAMLDLTVWLTTARRILQAQALGATPPI